MCEGSLLVASHQLFLSSVLNNWRTWPPQAFLFSQVLVSFLFVPREWNRFGSLLQRLEAGVETLAQSNGTWWVLVTHLVVVLASDWIRYSKEWNSCFPKNVILSLMLGIP